MTKKIRVGILKLESCSGCTNRILIHDMIESITEHVEIISLNKAKEKVDIILIEGGIINDAQEQLANEVGMFSDNFILFGSCAISPSQILGFPRLKSCSDTRRINFKVAGCPPSYEAIERMFTDITQQKKQAPYTFPVCDDCNKNEIMCIRLSGKPCEGDTTTGDCKILCPKIGRGCTSCRTHLGVD